MPEDTPAPAAPATPADTPASDAADGSAPGEEYGVWVKRWSLAGSRSDPDSIDAAGRRTTVISPAAGVAIGAEGPDQLDVPPARDRTRRRGRRVRQGPVDVERELRAMHDAIAALRREARARFTPDTAGSDPADPSSETTRQTPPAPR